MVVKKRKTQFIIDPSPLLSIPNEVVDPNQVNLKQAGLWEFVCTNWPIANAEKVLAFLVGSSRGAKDEFLIEDKVVTFDLNTIKQHFPYLPEEGATLMAVKLLNKAELEEIFEVPEEALEKDKYVSDKARESWKEWLQYVNQRLFMAPDGVEHILPQGVAAAFRSWKGERLHWTKILYTQIRVEIAGQTTKSHLFFHSATYLSAFCPQLQDQYSMRQSVEERIASRSKRRRFVLPQEECEVDEAPRTSETPQAGSPKQLPKLLWEPMTSPKQFNQVVVISSDPEPEEGDRQSFHSPETLTAQKKKSMAVTPDIGSKTPVRNLVVEMGASPDQAKAVGIRADSLKSPSSVKLQNTPKEKATATPRKESLILQCQASNEEMIKTRGDTEKQLLRERADLVEELKQAQSTASHWKKKWNEFLSQKIHFEELKVEVTKLRRDYHVAKEQLKTHEAHCEFEKEKASKLEKELGSLREHLKEQRLRLEQSVPVNEISQLADKEQEMQVLMKANDQLQAQLIQMHGMVNNLMHSIWHQELSSPPSFSLFRSYELQRDAFFRINNVVQGSILSDEEIDRVWTASANYINMQNLFCEILARADLEVSNPRKYIVPIGDLGARVLQYYMNLESQLNTKRHSDEPEEPYRNVRIPKFKPNSLPADPETLSEWQAILLQLVRDFSDDQIIPNVLSYVRDREDLAQRGELIAAHYLYSHVRVNQRLQHALDGTRKQLVDTEDFRRHAQMLPLPVEYKIPIGLGIILPVSGSYLNQRFLGNYDMMFDSEEEKPFPTWAAIEWILQDVGLSPKVWRPWDKAYPRVSASWTTVVPVAVATNPHLCPLRGPRRNKWPSWSRIDTVPYNWPLIPGIFNTYHECAVSYRIFFEAHKLHTDPICFRAAIFCNYLAYVCSQYKIIINVNRYDETKPEFFIWVKLQQKPTRWIRMLECMAITQFLMGPSSMFALEFSEKRQQQISNWLIYQCTHATFLRNTDEDVRRNIDGMDFQTYLQEMEFADDFTNKRTKLNEKRRV